MADYPAPADASTDPVRVGDIVRVTSNVIENTDGETDPTNMLGIAKSHNNTAAREEAVDPTRILVEHFTDEAVVWFEGSRAPLATDKLQSYGLVQASDGAWIVDATETTNKRVFVLDVDLTRNAWFCIVLAANRQAGPVGA
jgi:hypothetical protein